MCTLHSSLRGSRADVGAHCHLPHTNKSSENPKDWWAEAHAEAMQIQLEKHHKNSKSRCSRLVTWHQV